MSNDFGLSPEECVALGKILKGRRAWISGLAEPARGDLVRAGYIVLWTTDKRGRVLEGGPYATLTPWGAERLGVELRERRWVKWIHNHDRCERVLIEEPYWAQVTNRLPRSFVLPHQAHQCGLDYPELVPDPAPGPEYLVDEEGAPVTLLGGYKARIDYRLHHHNSALEVIR